MGIYTKVATDGGKWVEIGTDGSVGADLIGDVAGWAAIESVSGAASLDDLKAAGIAPESAIADNECPGTYNITADGVVWRVAVWTDTTQTHTLTTSGGLVDVFMVGCGWGGSGSRQSGNAVYGLHKISSSETIQVGKVIGGSPEAASMIGDLFTRLGGNSGRSGTGALQNVDDVSGFTSNITGSSVEYGRHNADQIGSGGESKSGQPGIVIVRAPKDAANNPKPDVSMPWGDFTTNGDENASGEWGPDGEGRTWKWAEWNVANDYSVNLTGGLYWVLTTSAGSNGPSSEMGQPGTVVEGYWEFSPGDTPITVGEAFPKGPNAGQGGGGGPSSIGDYGNQGWTSWGDPNIGRGSTPGYGGTLAERYLGYSSTITGVPQGYAPSSLSTSPLNDRPGRSGYDGSTLATDGCVIIATVTNDPSEWNPPGALPGIGGWATITGVSGDYEKHTYTDADGDWVAYEFTADGYVTTTAGLADLLVVGPGMYYSTATAQSQSGGRVSIGLRSLPSAKFKCIVGIKKDQTNRYEPGSSFIRDDNNEPIAVGHRGVTYTTYPAAPYGAFADMEGGQYFNGYKSSITGVEKEYGQGYKLNVSLGVDPGAAGQTSSQAKDGVVIIRVPAANAQGVSETRHGWLNFATVENGVVTSVNKTPDNIPYTTAVDEVPCGPEVTEGWNYDGSEFVAPEPDYSEQIKELEEQLKNLRGDL